MFIGGKRMDSIIKQADVLVHRFKTRNPFEIAENLNITVKYDDFAQLKGFYNCTYRNRFIVINPRLNEIELSITCAHELGHDRLHRKRAKLGLMKDYNLFDITDICEREANLFAAQLLIASSVFLGLANSQYTYAQIAAKLNVHEELAKLKGAILIWQGHNINIPHLPSSTYLEKK